MLEPPHLQDDLLITHLYAEHGLRVTHIAFLPLGADVNTAVYRVDADNGQAYFLKLRSGPFDELSAAIPACLGDLGIRHIIAPLRTPSGQHWSRLEPFTVILYPFVPGTDAFELDLSQSQWVEFGAALKSIHTADLPPVLRHKLPRETWSPYWRDQVRAYQAQIGASIFDDPISAQLASFLCANAATVQELVERADQLARVLQGRSHDLILCHADMHAGNLLVESSGAFYIVDWDTALLAPKERDLMFVGSGLGHGWNTPRETAWFYQGYGPTSVDPMGVSYYRCERAVQDIAEFYAQILPATRAELDRRQGLRYLMSSFDPGGVIEIALESRISRWNARSGDCAP